MSDFPDMMVDIETTHTDPHRGGIIQLAGVKFNSETGEIGGTFNRFPSLIPGRHWDDDTREWWKKQGDVLSSIIARQEHYMPVYNDFVQFARDGAPEGGYRFWSKPLTFDWPFIDSHLRQLDLLMPFAFRIARDLNSFCAGLKGNAEHPNIDLDVEFNGNMHDALHDCAFQIDCLMNVRRHFIPTEVM